MENNNYSYRLLRELGQAKQRYLMENIVVKLLRRILPHVNLSPQ